MASSGKAPSPSVKKVESPLQPVVEALDALLLLEDDWDGDGAVRYEKRTVQRARTFVRRFGEYLESTSRVAPLPEVGPSRDGSVDLIWKTAHGRLVVTIPAGRTNEPEIYGEFGGITIEGPVKIEDHPTWRTVWTLLTM